MRKIENEDPQVAQTKKNLGLKNINLIGPGLTARNLGDMTRNVDDT